ncbi:MAG: agmatinase [Pseudomonadales bacterium]
MAEQDKQEKLERLRQLYGNAGGSDMHDAHFQHIASMIFSDGDRRSPPYAGVPTFLDAPLRQYDSEKGTLSDLDVALFGIPMDLGVTNRNGARFGPRALRTIERIGPYNDVLRCAPVHEMAVADIGDVPMQSRFDLNQSHQDIFDFTQGVLADRVIPLSVGGDHSVTHPVLKALGANGPVGMVHIDAHCDTGGPYEGEKFHHGGPFRNAVLDGVLDPERTIQIGIRGNAEYIWEFSEASGMTVIRAHEISDMGLDAVIAKAREIVGDLPFYLSFDVDGLDPVFAPGTGTPEVGGLSSREALAIVRGMAGADIIGGDVVEVAPQYDPTTNTAHVAAQMLFEILSLIQLNPKRQAK